MKRHTGGRGVQGRGQPDQAQQQQQQKQQQPKPQQHQHPVQQQPQQQQRHRDWSGAQRQWSTSSHHPRWSYPRVCYRCRKAGHFYTEGRVTITPSPDQPALPSAHFAYYSNFSAPPVPYVHLEPPPPSFSPSPTPQQMQIPSPPSSSSQSPSQPTPSPPSSYHDFDPTSLSSLQQIRKECIFSAETGRKEINAPMWRCESRQHFQNSEVL